MTYIDLNTWRERNAPKAVILVYTNGGDLQAEDLTKRINQLKTAETSFFHNGAHLIRALKRGGPPRPIIVFKAFDHDDLTFIHSMRDVISYARLILVLPDSDEDTISMAHSLYPRFLTFADGDMGDVRAVVDKMIGNDIRTANMIRENACGATTM